MINLTTLKLKVQTLNHQKIPQRVIKPHPVDKKLLSRIHKEFLFMRKKEMKIK